MVMPVSLMNMEMLLGYGLNSSAPSMYNNYNGNYSGLYGYYPYSNYSNLAFQGYNNGAFGQAVPNNNTAQQTNPSGNVFAGLTEVEKAALKDCYVKAPSESVLGAAWGGITFGLMNNPRFIAHPINSIKAFKGVQGIEGVVGADKLFADVLKKGSALNKLWENPLTNSVMRDAYGELNRVHARGFKKLGLFRKAYSEENVKNLEEIMSTALKEAETSSPAKARKILAEATAKLRSAYVTDGPLRFIGNPLNSISGGSKAKTIKEGLDNKEFIESTKKSILGIEEIGKDAAGKAIERSINPQILKESLKKHANVKAILGWAAFEFALGGIGKIRKCRQKDKENRQNGIKSNYGSKQFVQTTVKGLGSGLGWCVGEGVGAWAFAKWGMKLGAKFHPAIGAAIGGVAGLVGGSIGMMLMGRVSQKFVGTDASEIIEAQEMTQTQEGQVQLLQTVAEKIKKGEASPEAQAALQKVLLQYA